MNFKLLEDISNGIAVKGIKLDTYTARCLTNDSFPNALSRYKYYWEIANDLETFKNYVLDDNSLDKYQGTAVLLKDNADYIASVLNQNQCYFSYSDGGSMMIYSDDFKIHIPNGSGDGQMLISVLDQHSNTNAFKFLTSIDGKFSISRYDHGALELLNCEGRFGIYVHEGMVVLESWNENYIVRGTSVPFDEVKAWLHTNFDPIDLDGPFSLDDAEVDL